MTRRTLVCGSLAYDTIMVFPDRFDRHILPGETHVLSVSFQIAEMRRGGVDIDRAPQDALDLVCDAHTPPDDHPALHPRGKRRM